MKKPIAIIAGEPNSISSEIIFKSWKSKNTYKHKPFFIIGSFKLLKSQMRKLKYNIEIKKIDKNLKKKDFINNKLLICDIKYNQKKAFENISSKSNKYIFECFNLASELANKKKILGIINCPVSKEFLFKKKHQGITEYLSEKENKKDNGVMLIYNRKLSVSPITTHIPIDQVSKKIKKKKL